MYRRSDQWLTSDGLLLIEGWARDGLIDKQIAKNMGISIATLTRWKNAYPEIRNALSRGKDVVDREVENALLKRALGYEYIEKKIEAGPKGITTTTTTKMVLPDVTAQIYWLKNRMPKKYRDKQQTELDEAEQKARIEALQVKLPDNTDEEDDDGFLQALNGSAAEDWADEESEI